MDPELRVVGGVDPAGGSCDHETAGSVDRAGDWALEAFTGQKRVSVLGASTPSVFCGHQKVPRTGFTLSENGEGRHARKRQRNWCGSGPGGAFQADAIRGHPQKGR
jgi:hypothetical protein